MASASGGHLPAGGGEQLVVHCFDTGDSRSEVAEHAGHLGYRLLVGGVRRVDAGEAVRGIVRGHPVQEVQVLVHGSQRTGAAARRPLEYLGAPGRGGGAAAPARAVLSILPVKGGPAPRSPAARAQGNAQTGQRVYLGAPAAAGLRRRALWHTRSRTSTVRVPEAFRVTDAQLVRNDQSRGGGSSPCSSPRRRSDSAAGVPGGGTVTTRIMSNPRGRRL